jgi:signal peptidase
MSDRTEERDRRLTIDPSGPRGDRGGSFLDDFVTSIFAVLGIGVLLFAISGVWPPMVAIESPSMEPNIDTGDLVFVMEEHRFASDHQIDDTGVVTAYEGQEVGYYKFNHPGDVIVYAPSGNTDATPIIHRAAVWVEKDENWIETKAQTRFLPRANMSCEDVDTCPADHAGFITIGDNNGQYDQLTRPQPVSEPVKPEWVIGTAERRVPGLGRLRLGVGTITPPGTPTAAALAV